MPGPSVFPSREPGVSGGFWAILSLRDHRTASSLVSLLPTHSQREPVNLIQIRLLAECLLGSTLL